MPKDMQNLLQQAAAMQQKLQEAQEEAAGQEYEGTAGGGVVKAVVTGAGDLVSVTFDPSVLDPDDPELVGDLVVAAVNQAHEAAKEAMAGDISAAAGGLDLDGLGLGGLLGG
jgi:DNA-binding YbaB/EbfC family protein